MTVRNKHDDACLSRREKHPLLCTCDMTDAELEGVEIAVLVRPDEYETDAEWAMASTWDRIDQEEELAEAKYALATIGAALKHWTEYVAEIEADRAESLAENTNEEKA